jgi:hypothetical protein
MRMVFFGSRIAAIGVVCLIGTAGIARTNPHDDPAHKSFLRAKITMADGSGRTVTVQGVGCPATMCSRVRARDVHAEDVWLDGIASVSEISRAPEGPVTARCKFKDGTERQTAIVATNRVLYIEGRFGRTERVDLASLTEIEFE